MLLTIRQFCYNWSHSTYDPTWWWTPMQRLIIYCDLCNHPIMVHWNLSKDKKKPSRVCIRFFIYDWTLTNMTLIHSHHIFNHILIRITIVIYNSMHVASIRNWPNHPLYYDIVKNIWFSVCIPIYLFLHELFFVEDGSLQHLNR
jgi:hypothetical protein